MTRATLAVRDDYSDSDEDHYVQFEDPGFFMGTRNKDRGDVFTASEDSDIQSGVPQGVQWEPVVEEHTSPRVERSSSEISSQPLRRSARNTCWPIHYHNGTYLLYPHTFKGLYGIFDTDKTSETLDSIRDTCDNGTWMQMFALIFIHFRPCWQPVSIKTVMPPSALRTVFSCSCIGSWCRAENTFAV